MAKTIDQLSQQNQILYNKISQLQEEKSKMRKDFTEELISYKSSIQSKLKMENQQVLTNNEKVSVSLFNALEGIDNETLKIVNDKIVEVKDQAENKITKIKLAAEEMQDKINAYRKLDSKLHMLMEFDVRDIINALPKIKPNVQDVFYLFV